MIKASPDIKNCEQSFHPHKKDKYPDTYIYSLHTHVNNCNKYDIFAKQCENMLLKGAFATVK